ncbi:hypothetical protein [Marinobacter orientalis]|uniref:Uncharacterized protein n=1 Tax=Marinobacter orientalis TaxID=1928859 RepID=A0A7Y0NJW7_9GAMM|nr:hypothetical protein [Marinobacter orientalis]NMT62187.1 hypothetical protein [Marinobacter orientalis]TGX50904.1 hypothetical protein DIT72_02380 [Marinobacter orientalis]
MKKRYELSVDDYIRALEKMKKSPRDRIGILGELGATGLGGIAGAGVAGATASAAGVATIFGSSTFGSILGGIFVTTTPVGWVVGSVVVGGAVGYGISKLVSSGGKSDAIKKMNINELQQRVRQLQDQSLHTHKSNDKMRKVIEGIQLLIKNHKLTQRESTELLTGIEKGNLTVEFVFDTINEILASSKINTSKN